MFCFDPTWSFPSSEKSPLSHVLCANIAKAAILWARKAKISPLSKKQADLRFHATKVWMLCERLENMLLSAAQENNSEQLCLIRVPKSFISRSASCQRSNNRLTLFALEIKYFVPFGVSGSSRATLNWDKLNAVRKKNWNLQFRNLFRHRMGNWIVIYRDIDKTVDTWTIYFTRVKNKRNRRTEQIREVVKNQSALISVQYNKVIKFSAMIPNYFIYW